MEYEQQQYRYTGTADAEGDVYQAKRTIEVCFRFYRGDATLSRRCADAFFDGGRWQASRVEDTVWDSLLPGASHTTKMSYSRYAINPGIN